MFGEGAFFEVRIGGLAAPATILLGTSALLHGWKKARAPYFVMGVICGLPLLVLLVGIGWAMIDSLLLNRRP